MDDSGYIGAGDDSYHFHSNNKYRGGGGGFSSWGNRGRGYNPQYKNAQKWNNSARGGGKDSWPTSGTSMYQKSAFGRTGKAQWRNGEDHFRPRQKFPQYSEQVLDYFTELFTSDIRIDDLDNQLRIWVTQFIENSYESNRAEPEAPILLDSRASSRAEPWLVTSLVAQLEE